MTSYIKDLLLKKTVNPVTYLSMLIQPRAVSISIPKWLLNLMTGPLFLARLHEVHRAIAVTPVVHVPVPVCVPVPVPVRVTLALKFSRSPYLDNHSSESIHTWTIDTL